MKQKTKTEERIINAFIEELNEKEYRDISVTSITNLAQVTRTSFYLYYNGVDDLARYLCHDYFLDTLLSYVQIDVGIIDSEQLIDSIYKQYHYIAKNKDTILGLWSIHEVDFTPYLLMQDGIADLMIKILLQKQHKPEDEERIELICRIIASSYMTNIRFFLEHNCENIDFVVQNAYKALHEGDLSLLK